MPPPARADAGAGRAGGRRLGRDGRRQDHLDAALPPGGDLLGRRLLVGHERVDLVRGDEGEQGAAVPLGAVDDADHPLAGLGHDLLDPDLLRVQVHQAPRQAQAAGAEEDGVDPHPREDLGRPVAADGHRRQAQQAAGHQDVDPRRLGQRGGDEQAVGDHHQLAAGAELQREVVRGGAGVERDRLALAHHRGRRAGDRPLAAGLQPQAHVERELGLALVEGAHPAAHPGDQPLAREAGEIGPDRDLRNRKRFRKFRNLDGIAVLEHAEHLLPPLVLTGTPFSQQQRP